MKKLFSYLTFVIALGLFFTLSVRAVTITTQGTRVTNTGTITVTGTGSDTFKSYQILYADYDSATNSLEYKFTTDFQAYLTSTSNSLTVAGYQALTGSSTSSGTVPTTSTTLDALMAGYAAYIKTNNISANATQASTSGTTTFSNHQVGAYLILPSSTSKVYSVMVGNVTLDYNEGTSTWDLAGTSIAAKVSGPSISKTVQNATAPFSYDIGETFTFEIEANLPTYPADATTKTIRVVDTWDAGYTPDLTGLSFAYKTVSGHTLTVSGSNIIDSSNNETIGTIASTSSTLTITFVDSKLAERNIIISYPAVLNSNAYIGPFGLGQQGSNPSHVGNQNEVKLVYNIEPYGNTEEEVSALSFVSTYGIKIIKQSNTTPAQPLGNAQFYLCSASTCANNEIIATLTTNGSGIATYDGLASGTYYIKEKTAPNGYKLDQTVRTVNIDTTVGETEVTISNEKLVLSLPTTGGKGIYLYGGIGLIIAGTAALIIVLINRKKQ